MMVIAYHTLVAAQEAVIEVGAAEVSIDVGPRAWVACGTICTSQRSGRVYHVSVVRVASGFIAGW